MSGVLRRLLRHGDLVAALAVVVVITTMLVPLPPTLLDLLIACNITGALTIVVATMVVPRALDFSSFPSLLLLTTLFRLAINVSVTRLVLLHGDAGHVIHAFGSVVVGGNLVVGLVVFMILVVIQFVVITNGAGRVAEVAARFTLDAMPGKQMSIDADLNAGQITEEQARTRREEISREADFYGAMDGASKFVKGDAVAGVLIVSINLLGGIAVGVVQHGIGIAQALHTYALLTVGDGIAAQIPALLISTATGVLVTRSGDKEDLGTEITGQLLRQPRAVMVAGGVVAFIGIVPGLPKVPFLAVGSLVFLLGRAMKTQLAGEAALEHERALERTAPDPLPPTDAAIGALAVDPLELAIGFGLVPLADQRTGGGLLARVGVVRKQIATDLGIVIAPVRVHDDPLLDSHEYSIKVRGSEVARHRVVPGHRLAMNAGGASVEVPGIPTIEPAFGLPAVWVEDDRRAETEAFGYTVVDSETVIVTHLTETIRRHADELLTRQETKALLDALKERNAAAVEDVVPDRLGIGEVQRVLQQLLREGVSIRDLGTILETIGDAATTTRDPLVLAEHARRSLARSITGGYAEESGVLQAISLDPGLEHEVSEALTLTPEGEMLALEPARAAALVEALGGFVDRAQATGTRPVLLCSSRIRRHLRRLVEHALPQLPVLAYGEVAPGFQVETQGVVNA